MKSTLRKGILVTWKDDRGFGFIKPVDGSQEIFIHITAFKDTSYRPKHGDLIYYYLTSDNNGRSCACNAFISKESRQISSLSKDISAKNKHKNKSVVSTILVIIVLPIIPLLGIIKLALTSSSSLPVFLYLSPTFLYLGMSLLTYLLYAEDKLRAKRGERRISEKNLHLAEMMGGWIGAFIAQRNLNHKSKKRSYQIEFWLIVTTHLMFWIVVLCFA
ncbi:MAG TPA: DUF1294 domain-containing protein [Trichocoleus sp.]|jgi:uncharacterized membrane protein YsdA (DUF1294 family)/cold shock CspA family protein